MYIHNHSFLHYLGLVKTEASLMTIVTVTIMEIMNWTELKARSVCFYRTSTNPVFSHLLHIYEGL